MRSLKQYILFLSIIYLAALMFTGCTSVFSEMQNAHLAGKGNLEVTVSGTVVYDTDEFPESCLQKHYGWQAAYGLSDEYDIRIRNESIDYGAEHNASLLAFGIKHSLKKNRIAIYLPVGFAYGGSIDKPSETWEFQPTIIFNTPVNEYFELNPIYKLIIPLNNSYNNFKIAFDLGFTISNEHSLWAIRPEAGLMFEPETENLFSQFSLGLSYKF